MTSSTNTTKFLSLPDFIRDRSQKPTKHWVIGNKAGDADSILSALTMAYVDHHSPCAVETTAPPTRRTTTPIVSIPKADLATQRPETTLLMELAGITRDLQEELIFVDDARVMEAQKSDSGSSSSSSSSSRIINVTLVDHNRLAEEFAAAGNWRVVEIWDHHLDEGHHTDTCPISRRNVAFQDNQALVASTGTLVVERLKVEWPTKNTDKDGQNNYPADVGLLLLGLILLDSIHLSPAAGKVTPRDVAACQELLDKTDWKELGTETKERLKVIATNGHRPDTTILFQALQGAKFDPHFWSSLSVRDALRLDYKQFTATSSPPTTSSTTTTTTFGMSTVLVPLRDLVQRNKDWVQNIHEFMKERQIDFFVAMLAFSSPDSDDGALTRQLVLCARSTQVVNQVVEYLEKGQHAQDPLQVSPIQLDDSKEDGQYTYSSSESDEVLVVRCLDQGNAKASRKQVAPILIHYFETITAA